MVKSQAAVRVSDESAVPDCGSPVRGVGFPAVTYDAPAGEGAELRYGC
ncbi:hypothetical protein [Nocardia sp. NPDC057440]